MSANNMYFAKQIDDMWYGWELNAEQSMEETSVKLRLEDALTAPTLQELEEVLDKRWGYTEYGLTTQPYLAKDGFPIEVLND